MLREHKIVVIGIMKRRLGVEKEWFYSMFIGQFGSCAAVLASGCGPCFLFYLLVVLFTWLGFPLSWGVARFYLAPFFWIVLIFCHGFVSIVVFVFCPHVSWALKLLTSPQRRRTTLRTMGSLPEPAKGRLHCL